MASPARPIRAILAALLVGAIGVTADTGAPRPAAAAVTPVYNAPPGGGPTTEIVEKFGPFQLDAYGGAHWQDDSAGVVPRPDGAYGLKYVTFDLVDENGNPFGHHDVHMHHFVIGAVGKKDTACPDRQVQGVDVQPLIGTGVERTPIAFSDPYALEVKADDLWGAVWHLMNMTDQPHTVYVKYTMGVQYGATADNTRFLTPYWADARHCPAGDTWDVPGNGGPGGVEVRSKTWAMPDNGYIVGIGGHMHDGGISIATEHEDGTPICENAAIYVQGLIDKITPCPTHDTVTKGELLKVTSTYDNSAPHEAVMGMSVMYLWLGDQGTPPSSTTTTTRPVPVVTPGFTG